ncbi:hypothetical protein [Robiginitalea biformata]|uniref:DUF4595 domain-containing protein n=1 Tax=Robiginitalea biformata (strain ATCC BAA-864 / DSM 15991 / KCTC 12146 / HTCC2501) TaxID=313596 RepID=A4CHQ6_ROBBH|nr:hypothetical protein [Robiginitalea biformata]EAR16464.1 hypothetical protein RB2501_06180 [Robiginitalea biformata HTCC2501]
MKRAFLFFIILPFISCSDSVSNEFEAVNGNVEERRLQSISVVSPQRPEDNKYFLFTYDGQGRLTSFTDSEETAVVLYEDNSVSGFADSYGTIGIEELYASPYDAFSTGQVEEYDNKGNPRILSFLEPVYDYELNTVVQEQYTLEISYDEQPNPYYYTLESAGLINVLDRIQLNFGMAPQPEELIRARLLFPLNNPSQLVYRDEAGEIVHTVNVDYNYEGDYPTSATIIALSPQSGSSANLSVTFQYRN